MSEKNKSVAALWVKEAKSTDKTKYFSGKFSDEIAQKIGFQNFVILKNNYKSKPNQPDYQLYPQRQQSAQYTKAPENFARDLFEGMGPVASDEDVPF